MWYEKVKELRIANKKTQQELANALETTQAQYWKYENGKQEPTVRVIIKLCKYYKISADYLLGLDEEQ